jgi:hypothetical protein
MPLSFRLLWKSDEYLIGERLRTVRMVTRNDVFT